MDLSVFEMTNDAVFVQLKHPETGMLLADDNGPVGVEIYGADSAQFKAHRLAAQNRQIQNRQQQGNKFKLPSAEEIDSEAEKTFAGCIHKFVNISWQKHKLEAPRDNSLFISVMPWAVEQLDKAMADRTLFMPALQKK